MNELSEYYPVLRELPDHLVQAIGNECIKLNAQVGSMIFNVGSACEAFPFLLNGQVRVERLSENGRKILLYSVNPGESCILTVSCLLGNADYSAMGIAASDIKGIAIPRGLFMKLVEESEVFRTFIFQFFSQRITHLMELVEELAWNKLRSRLAAMLLDRQDVVEATHQMLADELGSVREVVSRTLKDFEAKGFVKLGRGNIRILNKSGLGRMAHISIETH